MSQASNLSDIFGNKDLKETIVFSDATDRKFINKPLTQRGTGKLDESKTILFFILGMVERLSFETSNMAYLGRFDSHAKGENEIDLSTYGAVDRGVSRVHCKLELQGNELYVTDLDSSNGTYIKGVRLTPNQPYRLQKGDEIMLGRLPVQIVFAR